MRSGPPYTCSTLTYNKTSYGKLGENQLLEFSFDLNYNLKEFSFDLNYN